MLAIGLKHIARICGNPYLATGHPYVDRRSIEQDVFPMQELRPLFMAFCASRLLPDWGLIFMRPT
jgi:hypothetical protein